MGRVEAEYALIAALPFERLQPDQHRQIAAVPARRLEKGIRLFEGRVHRD